jgi:hypothetical protein
MVRQVVQAGLLEPGSPRAPDWCAGVADRVGQEIHLGLRSAMVNGGSPLHGCQHLSSMPMEGVEAAVIAIVRSV